MFFQETCYGGLLVGGVFECIIECYCQLGYPNLETKRGNGKRTYMRELEFQPNLQGGPDTNNEII